MNISTNMIQISKQTFFGINCKPNFSSKHRKADTNIMLSENGELIMKNQDIVNTLKDYFRPVVEN